MIRSNMMNQVTKPPMKKAKDKNSKNSYARSGPLDQTQCSPRKQMAMRGQG